jgi:hypothetical protein
VLPDAIDSTYIEFMIFNMFKIDIMNYIHIKAQLAKEFHIQPSEIDIMPAWEYELFTKEISNAVKEDNKRNEEQMNGSSMNDIRKSPEYRNIERMQRSSSNIKTPKMPDIRIPKM